MEKKSEQEFKEKQYTGNKMPPNYLGKLLSRVIWGHSVFAVCAVNSFAYALWRRFYLRSLYARSQSSYFASRSIIWLLLATNLLMASGDSGWLLKSARS